MPYENLKAQLSPDERNKLQSLITEIQNLLPFLINLTPKEKQQRGTYLKKPLHFLHTAYEMAQRETQLIPPALSLTDWQQDYDLLQQLQPICNQIKQLQEALDDTCMALYTEQAKQAILFKKILQQLQSDQVPGIDAMLAQLQDNSG